MLFKLLFCYTKGALSCVIYRDFGRHTGKTRPYDPETTMTPRTLKY